MNNYLFITPTIYKRINNIIIKTMSSMKNIQILKNNRAIKFSLTKAKKYFCEMMKTQQSKAKPEKNFDHISLNSSNIKKSHDSMNSEFLINPLKTNENNVITLNNHINNNYDHQDLVKDGKDELDNYPWFPKSLEDLNLIGKDLKKGGVDLQNDHPGFLDEVYKQRRNEIEKTSNKFRIRNTNNAENCEPIYYTKEENELWSKMWDILIPNYYEYAADEILECLEILIKEKIFRRESIPQFAEMNKFYIERSNFFFRPIGGLLGAREFLNTLAYRVFPSTQYIRHSNQPLFTPEPDIIHEMFGHAPAFINKDFVEFSQEIGIASLGASEEDINKLGTIYWYTIEFGVCKQNGKIKAYGGGVLSSPSELDNCLKSNRKFLDFDIEKMSTHPLDNCHINVDYFLAPSFKEMKEEVIRFAKSIKKPNISLLNKNSNKNQIYI